MERHFTEIKIDRPLIFLCGPLISEKRRQLDRRIILRDFITTNLQRRDKKTIIYQPIPIIVDEIFKKDYIDTYNLNLSLLEEIISSISFHTYIFLDTFSTSMELGLFSNSSASNAITVLVPEETRKNVKIGGFISTSIDHNPTIDICNYSSLIQTHENTDYVSFINNDLPDELANKVTSDNLEIAQKSKSSSIEVGLSGVIPLSHNVINYNVELGKLQCYVHFRTLFYLVSTIINEYNSNFVPIEIDNFVPEIARQLKKELLNIFLNQDKSELYLFEKANSVLKPPRTQVFTSLNNELHTLISHIAHIIFLIEMEKGRNLPKTVGYKIDKSALIKSALRANTVRKFGIYELFNLNNDEIELISSYQKKPGKYIRDFWITKNGKMKKIFTYQNNANGYKLRKLHEKISHQFSRFLPTSENSFAYKKDQNILKCLVKHLESTHFCKFDITNYFESIKFDNLRNLLHCSMSTDSTLAFDLFVETSFKKLNSHHVPIPKKSNLVARTNFQSLYSYSKIDSRIDFVNLTNVLSVCFFNRKLPIGFVTSPVISDFYLFYFDKMVASNFPVYTRYADDIMISSQDKRDINVIAKSYVQQYLEVFGLKLNEKKTIIKSLNTQGDSIRFLGANIVKHERMNRISISKGYLMDISKEVSDYLQSPNISAMYKLKGKMNYVKNISSCSYEKMKKIIQIKNAIDISEHFNVK